MSKNAKMQIDALQTARGLEVGLQHAVDCSNRGFRRALPNSNKIEYKIALLQERLSKVFVLTFFYSFILKDCGTYLNTASRKQNIIFAEGCNITFENFDGFFLRKMCYLTGGQVDSIDKKICIT